MSFKTHRIKSTDVVRTVQRSETFLAPNNSDSSINRLIRRGLMEVGSRDFPSEAKQNHETRQAHQCHRRDSNRVTF
jgi:hypothetical protein